MNSIIVPIEHVDLGIHSFLYSPNFLLVAEDELAIHHSMEHGPQTMQTSVAEMKELQKKREKISD